VVASILAPFALGYLLSYLYRSVNAVTAPDLVRDIGLSASELGFLTAAYLLAFAGFQLPLGVLLDRFGPRRVQAVLMAVTGVGALMFAAAEACGPERRAGAHRHRLRRGLMAGFQAVALWLPEERRALANSIIMAVGGVGHLRRHHAGRLCHPGGRLARPVPRPHRDQLRHRRPHLVRRAGARRPARRRELAPAGRRWWCASIPTRCSGAWRRWSP
jgi:hypothetical protein